MDLSVIIVSYKGYDRLKACLGALSKFSRATYSMEIILVNNNPGDTVVKALKNEYPGIRFIDNTVNGGYSNGCNLGGSVATGNHFLFLNPDTIVKESEISKLLESARSQTSYDIISCYQVSETGKESRAYGKFPWRKSGLRKGADDDVLLPDWVSGSVMLMNREVYNRLKGFDEDFWMYYEDVDLCYRLREAGGVAAFFKNIRIEHNHGASSREDLKTTAVSKCEVQISRHLYIHKHERGIRRIIIHIVIAADNLLPGFIAGLAGLILFFIPRLFIRFLLYVRLVRFYTGSLVRGSWLSPMSVNFGKHKSG